MNASTFPIREGYIPVEGAELYYREIGSGQPIIILHGGPDFDHAYLLPHMDRLSDSFRLLYYDQRGRGKSGEGVQPEDITLRSEIDDLERVREYFQLDTFALLGHSWGGLLALEYALNHPERLSHLILLNTAPISYNDVTLLRESRRKNDSDDLEKLKLIRATSKYREGNLETDLEYYRIHFRAAFRHKEYLEGLFHNLRTNVTAEGIRKARAIEERLYDETWRLKDFNLLPQLGQLHIPTLIVHGGQDFIPVEVAEHVAQSIPGANLVVLQECGHFSFIESQAEVHKVIHQFFHTR